MGRFGWKARQPTLDAFGGDAYLNEMGITSPFFPTENAPNGDDARLRACDLVADPEDDGEDVEAFAHFMRLLAPPPRCRDRGFFGFGRNFWRGHKDHGAGGAADGEKVFERIGGSVCLATVYRANVAKPSKGFGAPV